MVASHWRLISVGGQGALQFVGLVILSRLLAPAEFGAAAFAIVLVELSTLVAAFGIGQALIHHRQGNEHRRRVAFTLSSAFGLVATLAIVLLSWTVDPSVGNVLTVLAFTVPLEALAIVPSADLLRDLRFKALTMVEIGGATAYLVVATGLAALDAGAASIAYGLVAGSAVRLVTLATIGPGLPRFAWSRVEALELCRFGLGSVLAQAANFVARNGDFLIVGRRLGERALGLYSRAWTLATLPASYLTNVVGAVAFPSFAQVQTDLPRLRFGFRTALSATGLAAFAPQTLLAVAAPQVVAVVLGPGWEGAVTPLRLLCIAGAVRPVYSLVDAMARASGRVYGQAWRHGVFAVLVLVGAAAGSAHGIAGVALGVSLAVVGMTLLMLAFARAISGIALAEIVTAIFPGVVASASIAAVTLPLAPAIANAPDLVALCAIAALAFAAAVAGLRLPVGLMREQLRQIVAVIHAGAPRSATIGARLIGIGLGDEVGGRRVQA